MKVRIKYSKSGVLRFIGHLDIMRYFQKAIRRADIDIAYSTGYSPHQIISFAAPLSLGITSEGEYFDAELVTFTNSEDIINRLNEVMVDGITITDAVLLDENAKNSMSVVAASDYVISFNEDLAIKDKLIERVTDYISGEHILIVKKTKKSEKEVDIKPFIYDLHLEGDKIYMLLATGSVENLKPALVIEGLYNYVGIEYNKFDYRIHRIEAYMRDEQGELVSLLAAGKKISSN